MVKDRKRQRFQAESGSAADMNQEESNSNEHGNKDQESLQQLQLVQAGNVNQEAQTSTALVDNEEDDAHENGSDIESEQDPIGDDPEMEEEDQAEDNGDDEENTERATAKKRKTSKNKNVERLFQRSEGRKKKRKSAVNVNNIKPCGKCTKAGVYGQTESHSSARSPECRFYKKSKKQVIAEQLGGQNIESYVRKIGLQTCVNDNMDQETQDIFINNIRLLVNFMRETASKSMLFAHYYILAELEAHKEEQDFILSALYFCTDFFKACQQLVCGYDISNKNEKLKGNEIAAAFNTFSGLYPIGSKAQVNSNNLFYGSCQSILTKQSATIFSDHIVESFEKRLTSFFFWYLPIHINLPKPKLHRIANYLYVQCTKKGSTRVDWPNGIEKSEALEKEVDYLIEKYRLKDTVRPVTLTALSANPGNYVFCLY